MATLNANIREIRQTVYGRDMREPIADAIEDTDRIYSKKINSIKDKALEDIDIRKNSIKQIEDKTKTRVSKITVYPQEKWEEYEYENIELKKTNTYDEYLMDVITDQIAASSSGSVYGDFKITDNISGDSITALSGNDYKWNILNPVKKTHYFQGEDWTLIVERANGT